jgi:hypothetical protein
MKSTIKTVSQSSSIATPLLIVFIVLKLTEVIAWSWWWVLAPLWIPVAIGASVILLAVLVSYVWNL